MEEKQTQPTSKKISKLVPIIIGTVVLVGIAVALLVTQVLIPGNNYKLAQAMLDAEQYDQAIVLFSALGNYKDSVQKMAAAQTAKRDAENADAYARAEALLAAGD